MLYFITQTFSNLDSDTHEESDTSNEKTSTATNPTVTKSQVRPNQDLQQKKNIGDQMSHTLGTVQVSKRQYDDYQAQMKNQLVSEWKEGSIAKVYQGVELAKYPQFLDNFQRVTGVDQKIRTDFENMEFTDMLSDKLKVFTCDGTDVGGKYGMYMAVKRPDEVLMSFFCCKLTKHFQEKVDIAYAMFSFEGAFVEHIPLLERLKHARVDDLLTGHIGNAKRLLRKGDVDELASNFIVTKALQAFAHNGYIRKVIHFILFKLALILTHLYASGDIHRRVFSKNQSLNLENAMKTTRDDQTFVIVLLFCKMLVSGV